MLDWLPLSFPAMLFLCAMVGLAGFVDAAAGGGGLIALPAYMAVGLPMHYVYGCNKLSSAVGTTFSTARFFKNGALELKVGLAAAAASFMGSALASQVVLLLPDASLKLILLVMLPVVAVVTLRNHNWPDEPTPMDFRRRAAVVWAASLVIGAYDGYYGPGTGTFLMLIFIRLGKMDTRHAAGGVKVINLASNIGSLCTALTAGTVYIAVGLIAAIASVLGHYLGAGLAIKNGSRIVRPTVIIVLILLTVKVGSELLFPEFWS